MSGARQPGAAGLVSTGLASDHCWAKCLLRRAFSSDSIAIIHSFPSGEVRGGPNFLPCDRDQELLLPPSLREWLPGDHLAWFVLDAVGELDFEAFYPCEISAAR